MSSIEFHKLLTAASKAAVEFAGTYVEDILPPEFRYTVILNVSTDNTNLKQFDIYPNDNKKIVDCITDNEVVSLLYRKQKVPVWIDISVDHTYKNFTVLKLLCSGRYYDDVNEFYYLKNGTGPFGVKSPNLPAEYIMGRKFNLKSKHKMSFFQRLRKSVGV